MLTIKEALLILKESPSLNVQFDNFENILRLHSSRNLQPRNMSFAMGTYPTPPSPINQLCPPTLPTKTPNPLSINLDIPTISTPIYQSTPKSKRHSRIPDEHQITLLPEFSQILSKFNIDFSKLKPVALEHYRWWEFQEYHAEITPSLPIPASLPIYIEPSKENILNPPITWSPSQAPKSDLEPCIGNNTMDSTSPTISQRIRSMRRRAKITNVPQTG